MRGIPQRLDFGGGKDNAGRRKRGNKFFGVVIALLRGKNYNWKGIEQKASENTRGIMQGNSSVNVFWDFVRVNVWLGANGK